MAALAVQAAIDCTTRAGRPLGGGLSNHNFLASAGQHRFVVRIDGIDPRSHGLSRQVEWRTLQSASAARIAPVPRYFNPDLGAMVVDYRKPDAEQGVALDELAGLIHRIHALPPVHHRVNLAERIQCYQRRLTRMARPGLPDAYGQGVKNLLQTLHDTDDGRRTITHNDLLPANLLRSEDRLLALDWEYCGLGSPWFDLAVASLGQQLTPKRQAALLEHYLGESPTAEQCLRLRRYRALARYIELLWHLAESPAEDLGQRLHSGLRLIDKEQY